MKRSKHKYLYTTARRKIYMESTSKQSSPILFFCYSSDVGRTNVKKEMRQREKKRKNEGDVLMKRKTFNNIMIGIWYRKYIEDFYLCCNTVTDVQCPQSIWRKSWHFLFSSCQKNVRKSTKTSWKILASFVHSICHTDMAKEHR